MNFCNIRAFCYDWIRRPWPFSFILEKENLNIQTLLRSITLTPHTRVLDIGCGTGNSCDLVGDHKITGVDRAKRMVQTLRQKQHIDVVIGDALHLPFKNQSIDLLLLVGLSEYLENLDQLFSQLVQIGNPAHYIVLTISPPNVYTFLRRLSGPKLWPRTDQDIYNLCRRFGFRIIKQRSFFSQFSYLLQKEY